MHSVVLHSVASTVWQLKNNVQIMNQRVHDLRILRRRLYLRDNLGA